MLWVQKLVGIESFSGAVLIEVSSNNIVHLLLGNNRRIGGNLQCGNSRSVEGWLGLEGKDAFLNRKWWLSIDEN